MNKLKSIILASAVGLVTLAYSNNAFSLTVDVSHCVRNPASSALHRWDCQSLEDCIRTEEAPKIINAGVIAQTRVSADVPANNCTPTTQTQAYTTTINASFTASFSVTGGLEAGYAGIVKANVESTFGASVTLTVGSSLTCNVTVPPNECYLVYLASQVQRGRQVSQTIHHKYTRTDNMSLGIGCECFSSTCSSTSTATVTKGGDRVVTQPGCNWSVAPRPCCGA